ncbi:hypothetical protein NBM05_11465 [Rothia sp. AR01]|uniref:Uncharacterized protein n=1 Tax=Rothia santali TaxID=2949643 RepID=A0A9X2HKI2_9MICC|nr:hypothetical protein [Rothia santali]MCP3426603.1 hypothetical protein [Rothia santali]
MQRDGDGQQRERDVVDDRLRVQREDAAHLPRDAEDQQQEPEHGDDHVRAPEALRVLGAEAQVDRHEGEQDGEEDLPRDGDGIREVRELAQGLDDGRGGEGQGRWQRFHAGQSIDLRR